LVLFAALSNAGQASIELDSLFDGLDFFSNISRARFEDQAYPLVKACITPIAECLEVPFLLLLF
jgi:heat shock 70kDa protein 1/2/6/8